MTSADIGGVVRAARKDAGLRQYELAGAAGVGLRFIVELERGKPTAQVGKVLQVLDALGCLVEILPPAGSSAGSSDGSPGVLPSGAADEPVR